ncbi:hypothetical protein ABIB25_002372 [Nakamurella sp. UYEF19]|uniref:hypothetical protein n=1 Tax=Nakamurella sp. UYEF19 TaxID=1756392 RepID=UPI0033983A82
MTPTQQDDTRLRNASGSTQEAAVRIPASREHREIIHGRPRSTESEEAYLRSAREQAAIDIAAGW